MLGKPATVSTIPRFDSSEAAGDRPPACPIPEGTANFAIENCRDVNLTSAAAINRALPFLSLLAE
jgi:hypothetical protein